MDFFTAWYTFNSRFDECNFSPLTQLVGYKLLTVYGSEGCPKSFSLTDRELQLRTGIKSNSTIVEARRHLKNAGLIDFKANKAAPVRYVIVEHESSKIDKSIEQESSNDRANGLVPYTLHADEAAAATGAKGFPPAPPFPKKSEQQQQHAGARGEQGNDNAEAHAQVLPLSSSENELDALIDAWQASPCFCKLDFELISELELLLRKYGAEACNAAMAEAKRSQTRGVNLKYFRRTLESMTAKAGKPLTANTQPRQIDEYKLPEESDKDIRTLYANANW